MSYKINLNSVVSYSPCIKCKRGLSTTEESFCKDCKPKKESIRTLSKSQSEAFLRKFEANISSQGIDVSKGKNILGI
jgi:hypothetical protein